jgi:hypothetical protein
MLARDASGTETVSFSPADDLPAGNADRRLLRAAVEPSPEPDSSEGAGTTAGAAAPRPSPPPAPSAPEPEEIYEQVVQRLRRDLLVERERMGDLLGDLP